MWLQILDTLFQGIWLGIRNLEFPVVQGFIVYNSLPALQVEDREL